MTEPYLSCWPRDRKFRKTTWSCPDFQIPSFFLRWHLIWMFMGDASLNNDKHGGSFIVSTSFSTSWVLGPTRSPLLMTVVERHYKCAIVPTPILCQGKARTRTYKHCAEVRLPSEWTFAEYEDSGRMLWASSQPHPTCVARSLIRPCATSACVLASKHQHSPMTEVTLRAELSLTLDLWVTCTCTKYPLEAATQCDKHSSRN